MTISRHLILAFTSLTLFAAGTVCAEDLSASEIWQIKAAVKELSDSYAITRDNDDLDGYANNFAEDDGTLILYGETFKGREAIRKRSAGGNQNGTRMHVMSSSSINVIDSENASGVHYASIYTGERTDDHKDGDAINIKGFRVMGKYHDKYVLTDDGWKFAERRLEPIFRYSE